MFTIIGLMMVASLAAMAIIGDDGDSPPEEEIQQDVPEPESDPEPESALEPEPELEPEERSEAQPLFTLQTDPVTGDTNVTVAPEAQGRLMAFLDTGEINRFSDPCSSAEYFGLTLVLVPEDVDFEAAANSFDWQAFRDANQAAGITPDRADFFAAIGVELVQQWDLGERSFLEPFTWEFLDDDDQIRFVDGDRMPEITANRDIEWFELTDDRELLYQMITNSVVAEQVEGPEGIVDPRTIVESFSQGTDNAPDTVFLTPDEGDVVMGSEFADVIVHPQVDTTAITIIGGAGEDTITAGLNDTIITNDDTDADLINIDTFPGFAQRYDEVPVIRAGPEDVIDIDPINSIVISYEIDRGAGVTDYVHHIIYTLGFDVTPDQVMGPGGSLSLAQYYNAACMHLLAVVPGGSVDLSDPANPIDTRVAPPQFQGAGLGMYSAVLQGETVTPSTVFQPVPVG